MRSLTFVVDESGAKGFSNNRESVIGELGVMAGLLIPVEFLNQAEADISSIVSEFSAIGKLHITDLELGAQQNFVKVFFRTCYRSEHTGYTKRCTLRGFICINNSFLICGHPRSLSAVPI